VLLALFFFKRETDRVNPAATAAVGMAAK